MTKRLLTLLLSITLFTTIATAFEFEYNGLYYSPTNDLTAWVIMQEVSGDLVIPNVAHNIYTTTEFINGQYVTVQHDDAYTVIGIENSAFYFGCTGLTSVAIPNSIKYIDDYAFANCYGLTRVNITDLDAWCHIEFGVMGDSNPLGYAHHLYLNGKEVTEVVFPNSITKISPYAFEGCRGLTSITIPNTVTSIGRGAFEGCRGLTSVTIPNSVTTIWPNAFRGCKGLTSVSIPNSVIELDWEVFNGCSGLTAIYSKIMNPQNVVYGGMVFENVDKQNCKVYIPKGTLEIYKATSPWNEFYNLIEEEVAVTGDVDGSAIVDVDDVNAMINLILNFDQYKDKYPGSADLDGNGMVDVDDVNALINIILSK